MNIATMISWEFISAGISEAWVGNYRLSVRTNKDQRRPDQSVWYLDLTAPSRGNLHVYPIAEGKSVRDYTAKSEAVKALSIALMSPPVRGDVIVP